LRKLNGDEIPSRSISKTREKWLTVVVHAIQAEEVEDAWNFVVAGQCAAVIAAAAA
jgi:hypothetical protein